MTGSSRPTHTPTHTVPHCDMANAIRFLAADAVQAAKSGHPGMPMGMADVATVLFTRFLKFDPAVPDWPDRDRFVLSAGHGSMLLYALLHLSGYADMGMDQLRAFRQLGSRTAGHPEYGHAAGIETTAGPLGQGLANAVGMAIAEGHLARRFGAALVDHHTYVVVGDGCLMEGISQEAISMAGHLGLGKLMVLFDDNHITIDGPTALSTSDDQLARFEASQWHVQSTDGHDADAVASAIAAAGQDPRPSLIACRTTIGYGAPTKAGSAVTHGAPLGDEELAGAREALNWPHPPFTVPDDVAAAWRAAGARGAAVSLAWRRRLDAAEGATRDEFARRMAGDLPAGLDTALDDFKRRLVAAAPTEATRVSSGKTLDVVAAIVPDLVGGSADLTGSVNTQAKDMAALDRDDLGGRHISYGVREHAMAAVMNGMALHGGVIPYGGTFLVFTDYCRPAIRLSALMGLRVVYVMTHDSIGLGEDGPTHQPVEHLAALRAIPNLNVYRPADAVETAECWSLALHTAATPSVIVASRQAVPTLRSAHDSDNRCGRGAYRLAAAGSAERVTLLATGSEVSLAMAAREMLEAEGIGTAVVSMPCWALFEQQDAAWRAATLGRGTVRIAVEAAVPQGWDRYVGAEGAFIGMRGFGASAPAPVLYEHFGITAEAVVAAAKARL